MCISVNLSDTELNGFAFDVASEVMLALSDCFLGMVPRMGVQETRKLVVNGERTPRNSDFGQLNATYRLAQASLFQTYQHETSCDAFNRKSFPHWTVAFALFDSHFRKEV
jgi:hypothetical protein